VRWPSSIRPADAEASTVRLRTSLVNCSLVFPAYFGIVIRSLS